MSAARVLVKPDNPNHVIVEHEFGDTESASRFLHGDGIHAMMDRVGVTAESVRHMILEEAG